MQPLRGWDDLQLLGKRIARSSPDYSTNLFVTPEGFADWSSGKRLNAIATDRAVVVMRSDRNFSRIYHLSGDWRELSHALTALPNGRYVADLIGSGLGLERVTRVYGEAGFQPHSQLARMVRLQAANGEFAKGAPARAAIERSAASSAIEADAAEVAAMLERLLDPFVEQVPTTRELAAAAAAGRLLIARRNGAIAGMLMYDLKGQMAHLQYWHVDAGARGAGLGASLMAEFLDRCASTRRIVLWVIGTNAQSIAIYRHYGFAEDGLLDRIMILHKGDKL